MNRRYVIVKWNGDFNMYYGGSRDGEPQWVNHRYEAFVFHGETEFDAAVLLAPMIGGKVMQLGVIVETW